MFLELNEAEKQEVENLIQILAGKSATVAFAESCTGGLLSSYVTSFPGVSSIFKGSLVCYSNEVKTNLLSVSEELLAAEGAVSEAVAKALSENLQRIMHVNYAASVTGIAGPTGATEKKPLGMVCFGFTQKTSHARVSEGFLKTVTETQYFQGSRQSIQKQASLYALRTLTRIIQEKK